MVNKSKRKEKKKTMNRININEYRIKSFEKTDFEIVAVSNRKLCTKDFYYCISNAIKDGVKYLILREKDLSYGEYVRLVNHVDKFIDVSNREKNHRTECDGKKEVKLILNVGSFPNIKMIQTLIQDTGCKNIHLPFNNLKQNEEFIKVREVTNGLLGISVHDRSEAVLAERYGADYIMAGHIFETSCKPGLKPRGIDFLAEVCSSVDIPVYAIGGMQKENAPLAARAGARGICIMSGYFN